MDQGGGGDCDCKIAAGLRARHGRLHISTMSHDFKKWTLYWLHK